MPKQKPKVVKAINFGRRNEEDERKVIGSLLSNGADGEDIKLLKIAYDQMIVTGELKEFIKEIHWSETPATVDPHFNKSKKRTAKEGLSARTQTVSIFKEAREKKQTDIAQQLSFRGLRSVSSHLFYLLKFYSNFSYPTKVTDNRSNTIERDSRANPVQSREARLENRRHLNAIGEWDFDSELFKFNQLKVISFTIVTRLNLTLIPNFSLRREGND